MLKGIWLAQLVERLSLDFSELLTGCGACLIKIVSGLLPLPTPVLSLSPSKNKPTKKIDKKNPTYA